MESNSNYGRLAKLGALHRGFEPEYSEEDELPLDLKGAAQKAVMAVEQARVPSIYDRPQGNLYEDEEILKGISALGKEETQPEAISEEVKETPSSLSKIWNFFSGGNKESNQTPEAISPMTPERLAFYEGSPAAMKNMPPEVRQSYEMAKAEGVKPETKSAFSFEYPDEAVRTRVEESKKAKEEAPLSAEQIAFYESSPAAMQNMSPETKLKYEMAKTKGTEETKEKIAELKETGEMDVVPGAAEMLLHDPMGMAQFKTIVGINYDNQIKEAIAPYEALAKKAQENLTEEESLIRKRFETDTMTTQDKILLGLAIAIPAILGGVFGGAQGAIGAIAGGLKGISENMTGEEKQNVAGRKRLAEIGEERLKIEGSKSDLAKKIKESIPVDERTAALEGAKEVTIPETGQKGIRVGNDALVYNAENLSKGNIKADIEDMRKATKDAKERMEAIDSLYDVTDNLDDVYTQLMNMGYNSFPAASAGKVVPGAQNWFSADVTDPRTGEKMKASALISQLVEKGLDKYRTSQIGGSRAITEAMRTHFDALLGNPFKLDQLLSIRDAKNMTKTFQDLSTKEFIQGMETEGFLRQPLEKRYLYPMAQKKHNEQNLALRKQAEQDAVNQIDKMTPEQVRRLRAGEAVEVANG